MLRNIESAVGAEIVLDGQRYLNFGGSSYLGLSGRADVLEAGIAALGVGGAGYQLPRQCGAATHAHQEVEAEAAAFFNSQAALYLASGYFFGLAVIAAIRDRCSAIFFDELAHFSLQEAIAASGLKHHKFRHLDPADLQMQIKQHLPAGAKPLVVTDGLFGTFGEIAPLDDYARVLSPYDGHLLVDESHSFGVLGALGRGAVEHHNIAASVVSIGGSLGKAFGGCGGIIPATEEAVAALRSTPVILGAGAGLPAAAAMCAKSLRYVRQHPELLQRLRCNVARMKSGLQKIGLKMPNSVAPVASFVVGSYQSMQAVQERLMSEGIFVLHTKYIGAGEAGVIRCGIFADHTSEDIDRLLEALQRIL